MAKKKKEIRHWRYEPFKWQGWGKVIRHIRKSSGLTQQQLGWFIDGYSRNRISRYEAEEVSPPATFWVKMAKTFGLNTLWALTGEGKHYVAEYQESKERSRYNQWLTLLSKEEAYLREL